MANTIFRGPAGNNPRTVNLPVAGAYLPGIMVTASATALTVATAASMEARLLVLGNADYVGQDLATAYASGDTGVAYEAQPGETYQVRLGAATYTANQMLTIGASGYLVAATAGDVVYAYFKGTAGAVTAGTLTDVEIANSFVMAA